MGKVDMNKQQKQSRLMNTAFYLFTTKGIARTTISDIVREANMAKGTFYLYFHDKYELQEHLITWKAGELFQHAITHSGYEKQASPAEKVIAIVNDVLDVLQQDTRLLRFINKNLSWGLFRHAIDRSDDPYFAFFQEILGISDPKRLEVLIYTIVELVSATCHSVILEQDPVSLEQYRPYLIGIIRGILTQGEPPV